MDFRSGIGRGEVIRRRTLMLGAGMSLAGWAVAAPDLRVVYPRADARPTDGYAFRMLRAALQASGRDFSLRVSDAPLPLMRAFVELKAGGIDVVDASTGPKVIEGTRFLPFPLDMGLSGYRVMLVHRDRQERLKSIDPSGGLRDLTFGQGTGWVDVDILRAAGLKVQEAEFLSLFRMLEAGRFDALALGAEEAGMLLESFRGLAPSVVLLEDWCLHYRQARVFVVRSDEPELADALYEGLSHLFADGRAKAILGRDARIGPLIDGRRRLPPVVFEIANPLWTAPFQAIPDRFFFRPR